MEIQRVAVIVEDDADIRDLLNAVLQQSGFKVYTAPNGSEGVEMVRLHNPTVVTLDLGLPDIDGFEVIRQLRLFSDAYIVMLTARAEELDTLMGLEAGADDYITKPFRPRELRARISAMLRRPRGESASEGEGAGSGVPAGDDGAAHPMPAAASAAVQAPQAAAAPGAFGHNGLTLDPGTRTTEINGQAVELTRTEFDLLHALLEGGRLVRTKTDLVRRLRGEEYDTGSFISDADERTIEVHVGNLRRKLGDDSKSPRWLETVRGVGYRLTPAS
ncbi:MULTISPECIES: response regulator transcription factor [unclassified Arthrobacter]|uniref:response regulator transcription factor n=1 Tax=unclassified Arthrobacter TaxID=235627 RepID=UPI001D156B7D|nr:MULTISPECIES: response regulator transcription factor [unclassified Arthrobacter]MCC3277246.1 response regulator transcription factor [Arthrobacter sp. zg-Y20]MCC3280187.1 response regulator transcription factor [Arthrobacter sp. zg-Y40]MCC9179009.1 response regulator transcription factor [Arthrobacter sp. zg-Y750]MDK1317406.1 response regulator transcription factor [Arthrobacter sp. zg.Y20]MDK1328460.1 response regulator transcription factor [Arthrobacter sp. zg-Y1143]